MSDRSVTGPPGRDPWQFVATFGGNRRLARIVAGAVGAVSLTVAVALAAGGGGPRVDDAIGALAGPARLLVYLFAHLAVALGLWTLWTSRSGPENESLPTLPAPEHREHAEDTVLGSDLDETLRRLTDPTDSARLRGRIDVEGTVRRVAIDVLREETDGEFEDLTAALDEGTWTDDPRAAAYLGDADLPVRLRVIDWASGDPYRRRVDATVAELAAIASVDTEVESP